MKADKPQPQQLQVAHETLRKLARHPSAVMFPAIGEGLNALDLALLEVGRHQANLATAILQMNASLLHQTDGPVLSGELLATLQRIRTNGQ